jgi:hypothetical protein
VISFPKFFACANYKSLFSHAYTADWHALLSKRLNTGLEINLSVIIEKHDTTIYALCIPSVLIKGFIASATHMAALTQRIGWAYSAAMIIGKASAESAKTANTQQHNYSFCCNQTLFSLLAHKMIARAWQVSHASPGDAYVWSATGEDRLQRGESKGDDELARDSRRPTMSLGRRMIQWMEWRCMASDRFQITGDLVGFQFFIPFLGWWTWSPPLSMGWPAFVSVFISSAIKSWHHLLADHCSGHV